MADTNPPQVTRSDEDLPMMLFASKRDRGRPDHKGLCPSDHTIAAYTDGVLGKWKKNWLEFHMARCQRCRLVVADVVKARRGSDLPQAPVQLIREAMALGGQRPAPRRWVWAPAGALAGIALLVILTLVLRKPQQLAIVPPPAPVAPLVAKSEPPSAKSAMRDIVRGPQTFELRPSIVFPRPDSIIRGDSLQFSWTPVINTAYYEIRVVNSEGDPIWRTESAEPAAHLSGNVALVPGKYFVWVTAHLSDGRTQKSETIAFQIASPS